MTWELALPLIDKYGIPLAYQLWEIVTKHPVPTKEAWDELQAAVRTYDQYIAEAKARKEVTPNA